MSASLHRLVLDSASWDVAPVSRLNMCVLWKELDNRIPKTKEGMPMLAVGIDVSKSKSAAAILNQDG
ncbi:hypothetical protein, partial [Oscillibacter sp. PC13]